MINSIVETSLNRLKTYAQQALTRFSLRLDQELMVLRYVLFCTPSKRTMMALFLRIALLVCSFIVFASIQLSSQYIESPLINSLVMSVFLWVVANFIWEFGYTIQHVRRYASWLLMLLLIPLPMYISIYADTLDTSGSRVSSRFKLNTYSFGGSTQATVASSSESTEKKYKLNIAQMGVLRLNHMINAGLEVAEDVVPDLVGKPLNYPNPFRVHEGTEIGYELTTDMAVEIHIYNMFGHLVEKLDIPAGEEGGSDGYNKVPFEAVDRSGRRLSAGAYFYLIVYDGDVVGKGKMAVLP